MDVFVVLLKSQSPDSIHDQHFELGHQRQTLSQKWQTVATARTIQHALATVSSCYGLAIVTMVPYVQSCCASKHACINSDCSSMQLFVSIWADHMSQTGNTQSIKECALVIAEAELIKAIADTGL